MKPDLERARGELLRKLDQIEAELKTIGYWDDRLDSEDLREKFDKREIESWLDLQFSVYLQAIFLPEARESVRDADLPRESLVSVRAAREYEFWSEIPEAQRLTELLSQFDDLVEKYGGPGVLGTPTWKLILGEVRAILRKVRAILRLR